MAMTSTERQAKYRATHAEDATIERLSMNVSLSAKRALERLARRQGVTQRALLEGLIESAERELLARMERETPGFSYAEYYDDVSRKR